MGEMIQLTREIRKAWSMILVLSMLLSLIPAAAAAPAEEETGNYTATVYLDGKQGSNNAYGLSPDTAVKTMTAAYEQLYANMQAAGKETDPDAVGRIVITGDVSFSTTTGPTPKTFDHHDFTVLVTGETPELGMNIKKDYVHLGPTIYENITLTKNSASENLTYFSANGYPLVIGEHVTTKPNSKNYNFCLVGGVIEADYAGDSDLTIQSGTWRNVYVGNYKKNMTGDASLRMTGGTVQNTICSTYNGSPVGEVSIQITGGTVKGLLYGGNSYTSGSHTGDVSILIADGAVVDGDIIAGGRNGLEGNIHLSIQNSAVTGGIRAECSGTATIDLEAAAGKTLSIGGGNLTVDHFTGGGTLVLDRSARLDLREVTGETALTIKGQPYNAVYLTAPDQTPDSAFVYDAQGAGQLTATTDGTVKRWTISGGQEQACLSLSAPEGVTVKLSTGFTSGAAVEPSSVTTENGVTTYQYLGLEAGNYRYTASGSGFYTLTKNFLYTQEEAAAGKQMAVDPGKLAGTGFEPTGTVSQYTDGVLENLLPSSPDLWPGYEHVFETPAFTNTDKARNEVTTQEELMQFIGDLDGADDHMYVYTMGTSPVNQFDMPVVVFTETDLSGASTLEEAAALVNSNGRSTIHYQAQIHSNEPAGGEGALAMIGALDGAYGDQVLDTVNIYVIPRINVDGAVPYQRANVSQSIDMNRDHLYVQSEEIALVHGVYNLFMPEVAIDGHEFNATTTSASSTLDDVQVGAAGSLNSSEAVNEMAQDMVHNAFDAASELGLRPYNYGSYASTVNNAIGRAYYGLYGSLSFLIETRGIGAGRMTFERRVMAQYAVVESMIDYVVAHEAQVRAAVAAGRQALAADGGVYTEDDHVVLTHGVSKSSGSGYTISRPTWNLADGTSVNPSATGTIYRYDIKERFRPRPTAYVIAKGEDWAEEVISIMQKNGIHWDELEAGSTVLLQQYRGSATSAELTDEIAVFFESGAYVFPMNQVGANVIAMTMEPDVTDSAGYNGTLVQSGVVAPTNGMLPIYRYSYDLNEQGGIDSVQLPEAPEGLQVVQPDAEFGTGTITGLNPERSYEYRAETDSAYLPVPAGATEVAGLEMGVYYVRYAATQTDYASRDCMLEVIDSHITSYVIYVDGENGQDSSHGRTEDAAVGTLEMAYVKLGRLMKHAPQGTSGTICLMSMVTLTAETELPAHTYPVILTSKTGAEGIASAYHFGFHGDTWLHHMTIALNTAALRYISANGHAVVFGEGLTCLPSGSHYFNLVGGGQNAAVTGGANLTVQSGAWRNIYAAGYKGSVEGDVTLTITGGAVTAVVQTSYSGTTTGNVNMTISNAAIEGNIYGGNTSSKDLTGNVTITLGEGAAVASVYGGSRDAGSVDGTASMILDGAQVQGNLTGGCQNAAGTVAHSVVTLQRGHLSGEVQADQVVLDTSGQGSIQVDRDLTVHAVVGGGTVTWPAENVLTVLSDAVTGVTKAHLTGESDADDYYISAPRQVSSGAFALEGEKAFCVKEDTEKRYWYVSEPVTLTFEVEGRVYASIRLGVGGLPSVPEDPVRSGYRFTGWYLGETLFDLTKPVQESLTLSARWEADSSDSDSDSGGSSGSSSSRPPVPTVPDIPVLASYQDMQGHWATAAVEYVVSKGLFSGTSATTFGPDLPMTRGMLVTVLYRVAGQPEAAAENGFADVSGDAYYAKAVAWASDNGIVQGIGEGMFGPHGSISREQLALILYGYLGKPQVSGTPAAQFGDAGEISAWARDAMNWAVAEGLISGQDNGALDPKGNATRAEVAAILMRFCEDVIGAKR